VNNISGNKFEDGGGKGLAALKVEQADIQVGP
jgi:hypothetical protein